MSLKKYLQTDPADFAREISTLCLRKTVTYQTSTFTLGTVPANSVILSVTVVRTTIWNSAPTTFEIGKSGDADWLMTTVQANVNGAIPDGEAAGVERKEVNKAVTSDTDIVVTLNHGSAAAGNAYVMVEYQETLNL